MFIKHRNMTVLTPVKYFCDSASKIEAFGMWEIPLMANSSPSWDILWPIFTGTLSYYTNRFSRLIQIPSKPGIAIIGVFLVIGSQLIFRYFVRCIVGAISAAIIILEFGWGLTSVPTEYEELWGKGILISTKTTNAWRCDISCHELNW